MAAPTVGITIRIDGRLSLARQAIELGLRAPGIGGHFAVMRRQWKGLYEGFVRLRFVANSTGMGGEWPPLALSTLLRRRTAVGGKTMTVRERLNKAAGRHERANAARTRLRAARAKGNPDKIASALRSYHKAVKSFRRIQTGTGKSSLARDTQAKGPNKGNLVGFSGVSVAVLRDSGTMFSALTLNAPGNLNRDIAYGVRYGFQDTPHNDDDVTIAQIASYHHRGGGHLPRRPIIVAPDIQTRVGMTRSLKMAVARTFRDAGRVERGQP
ncbi:MAG: hypothetical protein AAB368_17155 [bacterium]